MNKIKRSKAKGLQKKAQSQNSTRKIVLRLNIKIIIANGKLRKLVEASILGLCSFAISSCHNIEQPSLTHRAEQTNINITATNVERVGVNIK